MCMILLVLTCLHVHEFIVTTMLAGSLSLKQAKKKTDQISAEAPCTSLPSNFSKLQESSGKEEGGR